jgi:ABC-type lipoprotein release transport system permease subunit
MDPVHALRKTPADPEIFHLVALTLLAVAKLTCATPAWRASRLEPLQALRIE